MSNNSFKIKKNITFSPVDPATIQNPEPGDVLCDSTDSNKLKKWNGVDWGIIGAESTSASNLGTGAPVFKDVVGSDLKFKSLKAETGLYIEEDENHISIHTTSPDTAINIGSGQGVFSRKFGGDLEFKSLKAGTNVTLTSTATEITISSVDTGEITTAENLGTGEGIYASKDGSDLQFKSLKAGTNVSLTSSGSEITINSSQTFPELALKADINSPAFTGTPTAPNPAPESNNNEIATTSFVKQLSGQSSNLSLATFAATNYSDILGTSDSYPHIFSSGAYTANNGSNIQVYVLPSSVANATGTAKYLWSNDGFSWVFSQISGTTGAYFQVIAYGAGKFVMAGGHATYRVYYSTSGSSWTNGTNSTLPSGSARKHLIFANNLFVLLNVGYASFGPRIYTSPDGITWTLRYSAYTDPAEVAYGNGKFVMIRNQSAYDTSFIPAHDIVSNDGITWTQNNVDVSLGDRSESIAFGDGKFVVVGPRYSTASWDCGSRVSTNGINWTAGNMPVGYWNKVIYGNGVFIATSTASSTNPKSVISSDGINWYPFYLRNDPIRGAVFGGGRFIITSASSLKRVYTSLKA